MSPWECIYHRADDRCMCWRLGHVQPRCPYYQRGECTCNGDIGWLGMLSNQRAPFALEEPAPTLMRFRA